jgi:long-chain acyl-CoA synthetase
MAIPEWIEVTYEGESKWVRPNRPWRKWHSREIPISINYPEIPIFELARRTAEDFPNNVAVYFIPRDEKYTYREILHLSTRLASALYAHGARKGKSVGIMMQNCPEFILSILGILQTGAACTPINPLFGKSGADYVVRESGIMDMIITDESLFPVVKKLGVKTILVGEKKESTLLFDELIRKYTKPPEVEIEPKNDLALLVFTGGTTGRPKGVMLTHYNITSGIIMSAAHPRWEERRGKEVFLAVLPLCHIYGFDLAMMSIFAAGMMVMTDRFVPGEVLELIERFRVERFAGIPTMYNLLLNHPDFSSRDLSSLQNCISGAAPLPLELAKKWERATGVLPLQLYGLTECTPCTASPEWIPPKPESVGIPVIDLDAKIVDESGEELEPEKVGELLIKCPWMMKGYWRRKEETEEVLKDGWLHTGDLAYMDRDGYLYIVGRKSDIIKYKGYKIFPDEIEEALYEHPAVLECGVVGIPDEVAGETIKAFITLKKEYKGKIKEEDIIRWAREKLSYKYPRVVQFVPTIPKTPVGKVFRRKLRERGKKNLYRLS